MTCEREDSLVVRDANGHALAYVLNRGMRFRPMANLKRSPAFAAFYVPTGSFTGLDEVRAGNQYVGRRKQVQHFRVTVSAKPNGDQKI